MNYLKKEKEQSDIIPIGNASQQKPALAGKYFVQIFSNDPIIEKLLSGSSKNKKMVRKLNSSGEFLILKLLSENALVILERKKSKNTKDRIECLVFINNSFFLYYQLICDVQNVAGLLWPNQIAFISINPNTRKYKRLYTGLKAAGWKNLSYNSRGKITLEKVLNGE